MWLLLCVTNTFTIHAWKHRKQKDARDATDPQAYPINAHDPSYSLRQSMIPMPRGPFLEMGQSFPASPQFPISRRSCVAKYKS